MHCTIIVQGIYVFLKRFLCFCQEDAYILSGDTNNNYNALWYRICTRGIRFAEKSGRHFSQREQHMLKPRGLSQSELHREIKLIQSRYREVLSSIKFAKSSNWIVIMSKNVLDLRTYMSVDLFRLKVLSCLQLNFQMVQKKEKKCVCGCGESANWCYKMVYVSLSEGGPCIHCSMLGTFL